MSALFDQVKIVASASNGIAQASMLMKQAASRISELETALNRMICAHENLSADTEGKYPSLDAGCIECMVGTVPDRLNTGLCAYHESKRLLGQS